MRDTNELLEAILEKLDAIHAALGTTRHSSVEVKTAGVKGAVGGTTELAVKAYEGSPIDEPLKEAIVGFRTGLLEIQDQQMTGWQREVDGRRVA
jgi:hypothetical protein